MIFLLKKSWVLWIKFISFSFYILWDIDLFFVLNRFFNFNLLLLGNVWYHIIAISVFNFLSNSLMFFGKGEFNFFRMMIILVVIKAIGGQNFLNGLWRVILKGTKLFRGFSWTEWCLSFSFKLFDPIWLFVSDKSSPSAGPSLEKHRLRINF